jgi:serine/threonine protein kinase/Tol biopolymer transport system component
VIGRRLAHYEITSHLGSGAMGEVYQATDSKLGRSVALKFLRSRPGSAAVTREAGSASRESLPELFARDPERASRFTREAKTLAAVNHPAVAAIYGLEEAEGRSFLVMELVRGQTLAERIGGRPMPWQEALPIARQIAEALEAAHQQGIVHRDLKPGNVKVTPDGRVKVLDFGLAKLATLEEEWAVTGAGMDPTQSPTMSAPTRAGILVGTPSYMAPEQAAGRPVDTRADIFAFGCVLYEILTGRRAFEAPSIPQVLTRVLETDPDWTLVPPSTPPALVQLLRLCLEKDPKKRRQSAGDIRIDLDHVAEAGPAAVTAPATATSSRGSRVAWWATLAVALAAIITLAVPAVTHLREAPPSELRLQIVTPPTLQADDFALSPDGRSVVYAALDPTDNVSRLYLRPLGQSDARPLPGTDRARLPFWSPDSRSVAYFAAEELYRIDVEGGLPQALSTASSPLGGAWNTDGTILFRRDSTSPLFRIPAAGGDAVAATRIEGVQQAAYGWPFFLPGGRRFLFTAVVSDPELTGVYLGSLDGGAPKRLLAAQRAAFRAPDRLVYLQQGALLERRFDPESGELTGDPVTLATSVGALSVSATGVVAYRAEQSVRFELGWLDRAGNLLQPMPHQLFNGPELSPDERRLAFETTTAGNRDVWLLDLARNAQLRFTTTEAIDGYPVWSPDGSKIAFHTNRSGTIDIWIKSFRETDAEKPLLEGPDEEWQLDWSNDGRYLLYQRSDLKDRWDLRALPMTGADRTPITVAATPFRELTGEFSPDSRWVAYDTRESGRSEIVVQAFPRAGERFAVSTDGGSNPRWSADGREIYFVALDGRMMMAPVLEMGETVELGEPSVLFSTQVQTSPFKAQFTVSRDGRFLANRMVAEAQAPPITLLLEARLPRESRRDKQ